MMAAFGEPPAKPLSWTAPLWISRTALAALIAEETVANAKTAESFGSTTIHAKFDPKWR
jgi:hypothetical protein